MAIFVIVVIIKNALLGGMVWRNLFIRPKFDIVIRKDPMVVIGELNNYYHQIVQFRPRLNASLCHDYIINIYVFDSTCDSHSLSVDNFNASEQAVFNIEDTNKGNVSMTYTISLKFRIGKTCLIAYTNTENSSHPHICLEAQVTKMQTRMVLLTTVVPSAMVTIIILICIAFIGYCCHRNTFKRQKYNALVNEEVLSEYVNIQ